MSKVGRPYSREEDDYILNNFSVMSRAEIAKAIGRTEKGVEQRLRKLKFFEIITDDEKERLHRIAIGLPLY